MSVFANVRVRAYAVFILCVYLRAKSEEELQKGLSQNVDLPRYYQLQHTATHGNTLQHTATHYNTLQHAATHIGTRHDAHCNTL